MRDMSVWTATSISSALAHVKKTFSIFDEELYKEF